MPRRVSLPGADELFRSTGSPVLDDPPAGQGQGSDPAQNAATEDSAGPAGNGNAAHGEAAGRVGVRTTTRRRQTADRGPSGRERHEEKITVYCSPDELFDLEQARLTLRGEHGLAVDRGRIVRESVAVVLADLTAKGESSILVRRLRGR
jgi:hypothetical protein